MSSPSHFSGNLTLDDVAVSPGLLHDHYLNAAEALIPGLDLLAAAPLAREDAYILVAGFFAETALKALIAHAKESSGQPVAQVLGHDLAKLWRAAAAPGAVAMPVPAWISALNAFHDKPYFIRYQESGGFYSLPPRAPLHQELLALQRLVKAALA